MELKQAKKQLLKNRKLWVRYYLGKPSYWMESWKLSRQIKRAKSVGSVSDSTYNVYYNLHF